MCGDKEFPGRDDASSLAGKGTRALPADVAQRASGKLVQLEVAQTLDDFRVPPGNRLEKLSGDRAGQHSISINRVCFVWENGDAHEVEVTDYH